MHLPETRPSPMNCSDDRHAQPHHFPKINGNRFGNVTFLRTNTGKSARGLSINEITGMPIFHEPHEPQRLAIAFRMGGAKIAHHVSLWC